MPNLHSNVIQYKHIKASHLNQIGLLRSCFFWELRALWLSKQNNQQASKGLSTDQLLGAKRLAPKWSQKWTSPGV